MNLKQRLFYAGLGFAAGMLVALLVGIWMIRKYPPYMPDSAEPPVVTAQPTQ
jgi:ABC-type nitrate/sulfonate/bicarbonate transport system permease component